MNELKTWENLLDAFRSYREDIYTFIFYKFNRSKDFAEDITQETFEKAWVKRGLFRGGNLKNWLFQIAINAARDNYRKGRWSSSMPEDLFTEDSEDDLHRTFILKSLAKMSHKENELVVLYYILGFSHAEIAEILKSNEGAIRVAVHRSFNKLKKIANGKI